MDQTLPQELDEQAMLYALGVLDAAEHQAFRERLQEGAVLLRQTAAAYQTTVDALALIVHQMVPSPAVRERLVQQIVLETAREAHTFEVTADTLALGAASLRPPRVLRDRLLSRIEQQMVASHDAESPMYIRTDPAVSPGDGMGHASDMTTARHDRHPDVSVETLWMWLRSGWRSLIHLMRGVLLRFLTSTVVQSSAQGMTFIKATEGVWLNMAPGVTAKVLSFDSISRRATSLVRFAPGTRYAPHRHAAVEELFVLEGGCRIAGREMAVGDYHRADLGTEHHDTSSDDGCVLLVISSSQNEMLQ